MKQKMKLKGKKGKSIYWMSEIFSSTQADFDELQKKKEKKKFSISKNRFNRMLLTHKK